MEYEDRSEEMSEYRKKPVVVEARQLVDDDACDWDEIARWCGGRIYNMETAPGAEPETRIAITTLEGVMTAVEGDWIIKGVKGEFYPCKPDIFEATYEAADVDHAEFAGWFEAQAYTTDADGHALLAEAFTAGMQAARDLAEPKPAPELAAAMAEHPAVYARWVRADYRDATDAKIGRLWKSASEGDRQFWAQIVSERREDRAELETQVARGDRLEGKTEDIAADLDRLRERVARTAAKLDADALATSPSKKSDIQRETAARLRETLGDGA